MFYRSQKMTLNAALAPAIIECLATRPAAALLATPTLRLFTNLSFSLSPQTLFSAFSEATFSGYAAATIASVIGPVFNPPDTYLLHQEGDFAADAMIGAGQTVSGWYLTDAAPTLWYAAEILIDPNTQAPAPFAFSFPGAFLSVDFALALKAVLQLNL